MNMRIKYLLVGAMMVLPAIGSSLKASNPAENIYNMENLTLTKE